jgi:hypothetical protein
MSFDFNNPLIPIPRSFEHSYTTANRQFRNDRIHLSAVTGTYRVFIFHKRVMLHIAGGEGRIAGKFNSDNGTGYFLSDGRGEELGGNEWIDFTWFGEKSSIRCVDDRRRVRQEREARGMMARVQRGYGSLQFSYRQGTIEAAVLFHGQGKGMDQWFRGPRLDTTYRVAPSFVYRRNLMDLQKRWNHQLALSRSDACITENEDEEGDIWESDDDSVVEVGAMDWEIIGRRKDSMFSNRSRYVNGSRRPSAQYDLRSDMRDLREWVDQTGSRELKGLKELKKWEESKTLDELDRLRHLKGWEERNGFKGLRNEAGSGPMMGNYVVSGGERPNLKY